MMSCTGLPGETPLAGCDMTVSYRYFSRSGRLKLAGCHRDGRPVGSWWRLVRGGGCVVGELDQAGQLTGHDIAYIYPDHLTALLGQFCDGVMVARGGGVCWLLVAAVLGGAGTSASDQWLGWPLLFTLSHPCSEADMSPGGRAVGTPEAVNSVPLP